MTDRPRAGRPNAKAAARQRAVALRAGQVGAQRRHRVMMAGGAIVGVLIVIVALVVAKMTGVGGGDGASTSAAASSQASAQVVRGVTSVPTETLDKVGAGAAQAVPKRIDAPALTADGQPKALYVGAEYCPFCAAQRWPVVVALSRFGTWSQLGATTSGSTDVFPNTQTLSFHGASYSSKYLVFTGVETRGNTLKGGQYEPLDQLSSADETVVANYDRPPHITGTAGGIPFFDIGGKFITSGASFSPEILAGKSPAEIAAALADPDSAIAKAVDGTANLITAAICDVLENEPANVCQSPGVVAAAGRLANA